MPLAKFSHKRGRRSDNEVCQTVEQIHDIMVDLDISPLDNIMEDVSKGVVSHQVASRHRGKQLNQAEVEAYIEATGADIVLAANGSIRNDVSAWGGAYW